MRIFLGINIGEFALVATSHGYIFGAHVNKHELLNYAMF